MPSSIEPPNPSSTPATPGNADRAMDALEMAAVAAEKGHLVEVVQAVTAKDLEAAFRIDARAVRDRLDRVVMGEDPELGLDTLLDAGALRVFFP